MVNVGQLNKLEIVKQEPFGLFLDAQDYGKVLLPSRFIPAQVEIGSDIEVFLYIDSDNQIAATTQIPIAQVGQWGMMEVTSVNNIGAFVNWGIKDKDLLIPFSEQRFPFKLGQKILVYVYIDKASERIVGTTKFNKWLDKTDANYQINQPVELLIAERSELGFKVIINNEHWGMIFPSEVIGKLSIGQRVSGFIKQIRDDGKIDLSLQKIGVAKMDDLSSKVMALLEKKGGYLPLSDKSSPEAIFSTFQTSKGTFKKSIGGLYKQGKINITDDGIELVNHK